MPEQESRFNPVPQSEGKPYDFETTRVGNKLYNVTLLWHYADQLPVEEVLLDDLKEAVNERHKYWLDTQGGWLGPSALLKNWESAQQNPLWIDHITNIKQANMNNPIWIHRPSGIVFNGMHRLTRAFLEQKPAINVRYFDELPESALVEEK